MPLRFLAILLLAFCAVARSENPKVRPGPLVKSNLEEMVKEWPWTEYSDIYEAIKKEDFDTAEVIFSKLILEIESGSGRLAKFNKSASWLPAQFFVLSTPTNVAIPILLVNREKLNSIDMKHGLDLAIVSSYSRAGDFGKAVNHLKPLNSKLNTCPQLESSILGLSSMMMHGYPALAEQLCTNFFGSLTEPQFKFRTNLFSYGHFAAIKQINKDFNGVAKILNVLRSKHSDYYAENHGTTFSILIQSYDALEQDFEISKLISEDLEKVKQGTLILKGADKEYLESLAEGRRKNGFLDDQYKPLNPPKKERPAPTVPFPPLF